MSNLEVEVKFYLPAIDDLPERLIAMGAEAHGKVFETNIIFENQGTQMTWKGRVSRVKAQMDDKTRTLPVIIEVDAASNSGENRKAMRLRPGMFVTARIKGQEVSQVFVLPRYVVYPGDMIYTVEGNRLKIKTVDILRTFKDSVIVSQGLSDGERIIKTPLSDATDGMLVRVK